MRCVRIGVEVRKRVIDDGGNRQVDVGMDKWAGTSHSPYYTVARDVPKAGIRWSSIVGAVACPCPLVPAFPCPRPPHFPRPLLPLPFAYLNAYVPCEQRPYPIGGLSGKMGNLCLF